MKYEFVMCIGYKKLREDSLRSNDFSNHKVTELFTQFLSKDNF